MCNSNKLAKGNFQENWKNAGSLSEYEGFSGNRVQKLLEGYVISSAVRNIRMAIITNSI